MERKDSLKKPRSASVSVKKPVDSSVTSDLQISGIKKKACEEPESIPDPFACPNGTEDLSRLIKKNTVSRQRSKTIAKAEYDSTGGSLKTYITTQISNSKLFNFEFVKLKYPMTTRLDIKIEKVVTLDNYEDPSLETTTFDKTKTTLLLPKTVNVNEFDFVLFTPSLPELDASYKRIIQREQDLIQSFRKEIESTQKEREQERLNKKILESQEVINTLNIKNSQKTPRLLTFQVKMSFDNPKYIPFTFPYEKREKLTDKFKCFTDAGAVEHFWVCGEPENTPARYNGDGFVYFGKLGEGFSDIYLYL